MQIVDPGDDWQFYNKYLASKTLEAFLVGNYASKFNLNRR